MWVVDPIDRMTRIAELTKAHRGGGKGSLFSKSLLRLLLNAAISLVLLNA